MGDRARIVKSSVFVTCVTGFCFCIFSVDCFLCVRVLRWCDTYIHALRGGLRYSVCIIATTVCGTPGSVLFPSIGVLRVVRRPSTLFCKLTAVCIAGRV